jgi:hypothetical protein
VDEITAWDTVKLKERYWLKGGDRSTGFTAIAMTSDGKDSRVIYCSNSLNRVAAGSHNSIPHETATAGC